MDIDKGNNSNKSSNLVFYTLLIQFVLIGFLIYQVQSLNKKVRNTNTLLVKTYLKQENKPKQVNFKSQENDIVIGEESAPLEIFLFTEYACKYCKEFFDSAYNELYTNYIESGKVKLIVRYQVSERKPRSLYAAQCMKCAINHVDFLELNKVFFENIKYSDTTLLRQLTIEAGMDPELLDNCLQSGINEKQILLDAREAKLDGVRGTPSFAINNVLYIGNKSFKKLSEIIEKECDNDIENCE